MVLEKRSALQRSSLSTPRVGSREKKGVGNLVASVSLPASLTVCRKGGFFLVCGFFTIHCKRVALSMLLNGMYMYVYVTVYLMAN